MLVAEDGRDALRLFEQHAGRIELVLLDMVMPQMGGVEARERILAIDPAARVLFATGYSADAVEPRSNLPLIAKPYRPDQLLARVREALDG